MATRARAVHARDQRPGHLRRRRRAPRHQSPRCVCHRRRWDRHCRDRVLPQDTMIRESLRRLPLFSDLSEPDLEWLSERAEPLTVEAGSNLIEEGDPGESAFIVLEGEFEVIKKSGRQSIVIAVREAGEVFGEMALIDRSPRSATVRAVKPGKVLRISEAAFRELLAQSPSASLAILETV